MNVVIQSAIMMLIKMLIGSSLFTRVEARVIEWSDKKISGAEKRHGVLDELEVIGLKASQNLVRLAIELAVVRLNTVANK